MKTIKVPDMMCENCVKRITNALTEAELKFNVSLADKTVTIDGCEHCLKTAMEELEEAKKAIKLLGLKLEEVRDFPVDGTAHTVIVLKKVSPTPAKFPRRYAKIKQNPL